MLGPRVPGVTMTTDARSTVAQDLRTRPRRSIPLSQKSKPTTGGCLHREWVRSVCAGGLPHYICRTNAMFGPDEIPTVLDRRTGACASVLLTTRRDGEPSRR